MATTLKSAPGQRSLNGNAPPDRFDLEPPSTGTGRSRWPEMAVGTLVVALFALAGAWFYSNASATEAVLSLRNPVERGAVVTSSDLAIVQVSSEDLLNLLPADQAAVIVGQIAMTDLSAGTLVTTDLFADRAAIESGSGVVGLALDPGEYPTLALRPGDVVRVVQTPRQGDEATGDLVLVESAEVTDVSSIGVQNQIFISLSMATAEADAVAAAGSQDRVRLIQIAGD